MQQFIHLRTHSRFSVGSSTLTIKMIPKLCAAAGMSACALTDTNLMSGCAEFSDVMPSNKLQPIIGIEITLNHHNADPKILRAGTLSKVVLLAQNHTGYLNLCELNRIMYMRTENHHLGPYITWDELTQHSTGLICLSGAHSGPIGMAILNNQEDLARTHAKHLLEIFGNRFYITEPTRSVISIVWSCSGMKQLFIFTTMLLLYPFAHKHKLWAIPSFGFVILLLNLIRLMVLFNHMKTNPEDFEAWHEGSKYVFYAIMFGLWILWEEFVRRYAPRN